MPYRTPSGALYDSGDYEACLDDALELAGWAERRSEAEAARAAGRLVGSRPRLRRRAVDLEHGLHHARPDRGRARADAAEVGQRRGRARSRSTRSAGSPSGSRRHRRDRATAPSARRSSPTSSAARPRTSRCCPRWTPRRVPWTVASGNYSSRFSGRRRRRRPGSGAASCARRSTRSARTLGDPSLSLRRVAGMAHWNPEAPAATAMEPGLAAVAFWATAEPRPARRRGPGRLVRRARVHRRHLRGRGRSARRAPSRCSTTSPSTTPGASSTRCSPTARCVGGFAHGAGAALLRAPRLRRVGQPDDGIARRLPRPDRARHPGRCASATARRRRRSPRSAPRGSARGTR